MHADAMQVAPPAGDGDDGVQQAAPLETVIGDVLVLERDEREARQDGVAVVPVVVDGVAAVDVLPALAGQELVLRAGPAAKTQRETVVQPLHLLQENKVGVERAQAVAQLMDHHAAVELRPVSYTHLTLPTSDLV